ncbi:MULTISPECIES: hypothetical protein [Streptomyces]|uniref:hypothetical protein n=1 Tax=Streptomyces TaxID=1883 RepID=UPI00114D05D0|nr:MULTISPECIES: hypothetical protein [Streptomyces]
MEAKVEATPSHGRTRWTRDAGATPANGRRRTPRCGSSHASSRTAGPFTVLTNPQRTRIGFVAEGAAERVERALDIAAPHRTLAQPCTCGGKTTSGWAKAIIMPDGLGSQWEIRAQGRGASASNGLWAHQVQNGQVLTFRKPKMFGIWVDVIQIGFLGALDPGDRVVFTWRHD